MLNELKKYRENLHKIPETGFKEFKTQAYILEVLKDYSCEISHPDSTAVCAFFKVNDGTSIALRSDMDALPNKENTGLPYSSEHNEMMHSCGHDGHMAMLLGIAKEINENIDKLTNNVLLIFQPAEEGGGGAEILCQKGILKQYKVSKIFGIHLWPDIPKHAVASCPGGILAKSTEMNIIVSGKSAHVANSEDGIDALYISSKFLCALYDMVDNELPKEEYKLLKFGKMESGVIRNSISSITVLEGTMRCFDEDLFEFMLEKIFEITEEFEAEFGCTIQVFYNSGYPSVNNDPIVFEETKKILSDKYEFITLEKPYMQAEDFSFYLQRVPGILLLLGVGHTPPLHSEKFNFDEEILETGVNVYKTLLGI